MLALYYQEELTIAEIAQVLRIPDEVVKEIRDATLRKLMNPVH